MKKSTSNDYIPIENLEITKRIKNLKNSKKKPSYNSIKMNKSKELSSKNSLKSSNSTLFNKDLKTERTKNIFSYLNNPEIDSEILDLYKIYFERKNLRKESEENFMHCNNKLNLLHKEEMKAKEKEKLFRKHIEKMEKIQFKNLEEKELLLRNKEKMDKKLEEHKKVNNIFKNKRDKTLKNFRNDIAKNNLNIISKIKEKRKNNYNKYLEKEENNLKNKQEHVIFVNKQRNLSQENKRQNEYEKKLKLKNELLKKIKEEEIKKRNFELETNKCQNESMEILTRIKVLGEELEKNNI